MRYARITMNAGNDDVNGICESQTRGSAGALTIDGALASGGIVTFDFPRVVIIDTAGDESGITFTVAGTYNGRTLTDTVTGIASGATGTTTKHFDTVRSVSVSAALASTVEVGTTDVASTTWAKLAHLTAPFSASVAAVVAGTINYTVQYTYDDPVDTAEPLAWNISALASKTTTLDTALTAPVQAIRVLRNTFSGTPSADYVIVTVLQAGL